MTYTGVGAGSAKAIMSDPDIERVVSAFGDGCLKSYKMDIRLKKRFWANTTMRQVQSFVREYGAEDAARIVNRLFSVKHDGKYRGEQVGWAIFGKQKRWLSDILLAEADTVDNTEWF